METKVQPKSPVEPVTYESSTISKNLVSTDSSSESVKENDVTQKRSFGETSTNGSMSKYLAKKMQLAEKLAKSQETADNDTTSKDKSFEDDRKGYKEGKYDSNETTLSNTVQRMHLKEADRKLKHILKEHKTNGDLNISFVNERQAHVNPFKNVDLDVSKFVEKLVSPILMVHSKTNRRIQSILDIANVPFNFQIRNSLTGMSVKRPMMLQSVSWFSILRGYSFFMIAPSGSGKTLGYTPAISRLVTDDPNFTDTSISSGPICIIVCATTKSVLDVSKQCKIFLGSKGTVVSCYPGLEDVDLIVELLNGCDILVSTPCALAEFLKKSSFGIDLNRLSVFVLDDCERLNEVYLDEVKYFQLKIQDMLKHRVNKEHTVQIIIASRVWCDFMEPLAKQAPDTIICISAYHECVLYSKISSSIDYLPDSKKLETALKFLNDIDQTKRTVFVCTENKEVHLLSDALKEKKFVVFTADDKMSVETLYKLNNDWSDYTDPVIGPILVCQDDSLLHLNVTNAHILLHYSLPNLYSMFSRRFSVLNDNYPSLFNNDRTAQNYLRIKIMLDRRNLMQLPKIMRFVKRCVKEIPESLNELCDNLFQERERSKAAQFLPICDNMLSYGECPDIWNCLERHAVFKEYDSPDESLPTKGIITFNILHCHNAITYSARLQTNIVDGKVNSYANTYCTLSLKMGMYYSNEKNKIPLGIPKVGDICAVASRPNHFERCQVHKILNKDAKDRPDYVIVNLIDEEKWQKARAIDLYYLPDIHKAVKSYVVKIKLAGIRPRDRDITFSDKARDSIKKILNSETDAFMRGKVVMTIGNTILVDNVEVCLNLAFVKEIFVKHNIKAELLQSHAEPNPLHITNVEALCEEAGIISQIINKSDVDILSSLSENKVELANLDDNNLTQIYFASAENPGMFFVRLAGSEDLNQQLLSDIENYVNEKEPEPLSVIKIGHYVLAKFPDDSLYHRARVDHISKDNIKCFFVDQGESRVVSKANIFDMPQFLIECLPFQAIECRLIGLKPCGDEWTEFSTNWFYDFNLQDTKNMRKLYVKYFLKEKAEYTGGHKYAVAVIDTAASEKVILNEIMLKNNLATLKDDEVHYLKEFVSDINKYSELDSDLEKEAKPSAHISGERKSDLKEEINKETSLATICTEKPESSSHLSEEDDWEFNFTPEEFTKLCPNFAPFTQLMTSDTHKAVIEELDSDDLTLPENNELVRKPTLVWHQSKTTVTIKIDIVGAKKSDYTLEIRGRSINFLYKSGGINYGFEIELYGVVDPKKSSHTPRGLYILVKLAKLLKNNWMSLTKDGQKQLIKYDADTLDCSSSEDENVDQVNKLLKNIIERTHYEFSDVDTEMSFEDDA